MSFEYWTVLWLFCIPEIIHCKLPKLCSFDMNENSLHSMLPYTWKCCLDIKHESNVNGCFSSHTLGAHCKMLKWYLKSVSGVKRKGKFLTTKWTSTFSLCGVLAWEDSGWSWIIYCTLKVLKGKASAFSSLHFRVCWRPLTICRTARPYTLSRLCQRRWCYDMQLPVGETNLPWNPPWCCNDLRCGFLERSRGGNVFRSIAWSGGSFAWALFTTASDIGRDRGC